MLVSKYLFSHLHESLKKRVSTVKLSQAMLVSKYLFSHLHESLKKRVSMVKLSQADEFFSTIMIFFPRFLLLSIYQNTSESIRPCFRKKSDRSQQP